MTPPSTTHGAHPAIGFIGAGNMARSLASGLLKNGWDKARIVLSDPDPSQRQAIQTILGVTSFADNDKVAAQAAILVLAVKPQVLAGVAAALAPAVQRKRPLVVSIAAGVRLAGLRRWVRGRGAPLRAPPPT